MASYVAPDSQDYQQQLATAGGISPEQLQVLRGQYGQTGALTQVLQSLGAANKAGQGANKAAATPTSNSGGINLDPTLGAVNLGASALSAAGFGGANGGFAVYNPTPSQIPQGSKGGVSKVGSPVTTSQVPQYQASGPGVFNAAPSLMGTGATGAATAGGPLPGTPTPTRPANAAAGGAVATPWATAPAAPGAQAQPQGATDWHALAAHAEGLENAGKAMYAHMTGNDPTNATHQDISGFHEQLNNHLQTVMNQFAQGGSPTPFGTAPPGAANYTAGIQPGIPATGATPGSALGVTPPPGMGGPKPMASGGLVPGRGNQDTVPALLTPGEYVIPKQQAAQIFGGRAPVRMAEGGFVWDDESKKKPAPETQRQRITPPGAPPAAPGGQAQPTQTSSSSQDSSQGQGQGDDQWHHWSNLVAQNQAARNAQVGSGGAGSIDSLGNLGDEGIITGSANSPAGGVAAGADIASSFTSALGKAADAYAKSIKDFVPRSQAFGQGGTPNYQTTNFQQEQV